MNPELNPFHDYGIDDTADGIPAAAAPMDQDLAMYRPNRAEMDIYNSAVRLLNIMDRRANAQMQHVVEHYRRMHQQQNRDSWCAFGLKVCLVMLCLMMAMRWAIVSYAIPSLAEPLKEMQRAMNQSQLALGETQLALKELQSRPQANAQVNCGGPSYPSYQPYY